MDGKVVTASRGCNIFIGFREPSGGSCRRAYGSFTNVTEHSSTMFAPISSTSKIMDGLMRRQFSAVASGSSVRPLGAVLPHFPPQRSLLEPKVPELNSARTVIKYSLQKGKRMTVKDVIRRFYRLDWGIWIRTKCGRHKHIYKKSWRRRKRLRQHVFTNATQSWLLDTMVTKYWRRPKYIPDDPYNPYHKREEFPITRKKPIVPEVAS